jgi:hypothetical protein
MPVPQEPCFAYHPLRASIRAYPASFAFPGIRPYIRGAHFVISSHLYTFLSNYFYLFKEASIYTDKRTPEIFQARIKNVSQNIKHKTYIHSIIGNIRIFAPSFLIKK